MIDPNKRSHCIECGLSFGLVDRSERFDSTCTDCVRKLAAALQCDRCRRIIESGEQCHLKWACFCAACCREINRKRERDDPVFADYKPVGRLSFVS